MTDVPKLSVAVLLRNIWSHLSQRRRTQLFLLLVVMFASGLAELISLGAVLPFLALLTGPEWLWRQPVVQELAGYLGWTNASQLLLPAILAFIAAAVLAAVIRLWNLYLNGRVAAAVGSDLSCEAYCRTLYQPYAVHVQRNTASVIASTTTQIGETVSALNALLQMITSAVVAAGLMIGLIVVDTPVAFGSAALFCSTYVMLGITVRRKLRSNSVEIVEAASQQLKTIQEGLGGIRDVLLDGSQLIYLQDFRENDLPQRQLQAQNMFLAAFPRYALEALGMVAVALLGGFLVVQQGRGVETIPLLGTFALGAQRLLPALQQFYSAWSTVTGNCAAMEGVLALLNQPVPAQVDGVEPMQLHQGIRLDEVHFRYAQEKSDVLQGLTLEIRRGERIGLIGNTGGGKSTMVNLVMGLLEPSEGRILVDGFDLNDPKYPERLFAWRASIAHVPQNIYLADSSIAENIAIGVPRQNIDYARVKTAAFQARISSFIESCPQGYDTFVGERGIRLSGGQRQRIGIARALYKNARVLVFDEATSALDSLTETAVMESIDALSGSITVIMIAHRLSTVERCDRVVRLSNGTIAADGPPHQVLSGQS